MIDIYIQYSHYLFLISEAIIASSCRASSFFA
jgi:hypothetical protein